MNMSDTLLAAATNLFRVYIIWRFIKIFFTDKKVSKKVEIGCYLLFYIITFSVFYIFHLPILNVITNLIGIFALTCIYVGSYKKRITVAILIYAVNMSCDALAAYLCMPYVSGEVTAQLFSIVTDLLILICEILVEILLKKEGKQEYVRGLNILLLVPGLSIFMLYFLIASNINNRRLVVSESIGILMINIVVFYLYHAMVKSHFQLQEKETWKQQIQIYKSQLETIEQTQKKIRVLRHDMKHHIQSIYRLASQKKVDEIMQYLTTMEIAMDNEKEYISTGNQNVDGILNYMIDKAKQELIQVDLKIQIPKEFPMDQFDMTVILGNLLENAIEAAKQSEQKKMIIEVIVKRGLLFIDISNTYMGSICIKGNSMMTTKKDEENHGLGLVSVREIVEKNNGIMQTFYENEIFVVKVTLYIT